jgi:hypothetical protein
MRILLDQCVPKKLKRHLTGHEFLHVYDMDWEGKKNGELLALMRGEGFQVFLTVDKQLRHQQNIAKSGVALVVLDTWGTDVEDLLPLLPQVYATLATIQPGEVVVVGA